MAFSKLLKWLDATKEATANKVALRGASAECSFGALTATSGAFSGDVAVGGTLGVTGEATFGIIASITSLTADSAGITDLSGTTLDYSGGMFVTLEATGNTAVGGDLTVSGTITGTLTNAAVAAAIAEDPDAIIDAINGEDDVFPATAFALADTSGLTLPANTLGRNLGGQLVMHDGITEGGNLVQNKGFRLSGSWVGSVASAIGAETGLLGEFPITAAQASAGTVLRVRGTIAAKFSHTSIPDSACIGISTAKQRTEFSGFILPTGLTRFSMVSGDANVHQRILVDARFILAESGSYSGFLDFVADAAYQPDVFALYSSSSNIIMADNNASTEIYCAVQNGTPEALRLYFSTASGGTGTAHVFYDLEFIFE